MSVETNKETARRFVEEVFNQNPSQGVQEFADQDYLNHDPTEKKAQGRHKTSRAFARPFPTCI